MWMMLYARCARLNELVLAVQCNGCLHAMKLNAQNALVFTMCAECLEHADHNGYLKLLLHSVSRQDWKQRAAVVLMSKRHYSAHMVCDVCPATQSGVLDYRNVLRRLGNSTHYWNCICIFGGELICPSNEDPMRTALCFLFQRLLPQAAPSAVLPKVLGCKEALFSREICLTSA